MIGKRRGAELVGAIATLIVTNLIKLAGLVIALREVFTQPQPAATVIALAAFMMAGAQVSEELILGLVTKMFGTSLSAKSEPVKEEKSAGTP